MKNFYCAISEQIGDYRNAYVGQFSSSDNLLKFCERRQRKGAQVVMVCESKKQAERIVEEWNETYKSDGTHLLTS